MGGPRHLLSFYGSSIGFNGSLRKKHATEQPLKLNRDKERLLEDLFNCLETLFKNIITNNS